MLPSIKAVIFDMDGVLIDAKDWHYEALNKALSLFGMEITRYDHLVTYDGLPTMRKLEMLSMERGLPVDLHEFINELKQQFTLEMAYNLCKPIFIHQYALAKLKKSGYHIAVCSNSVRDSIDLMMKKSDLYQFLDFFLSNQDVENGKPDPEIYIKAMGMLELSPNECLVIEDNPNGIAAARGSGAFVMEVSTVEEVNYENIKKYIEIIESSEVESSEVKCEEQSV